MLHYVLDGVGDEAGDEHRKSAIADFVLASLRSAGVDKLDVREPYIHSAAQAEQGLRDGSVVRLEEAVPMILSAATDDDALPWCRFEGPSGQYVTIGLDGEVYLGLNSRSERAEHAATAQGLGFVIRDTPSPYRDLPGKPIDPVFDETVCRHLSARVETEPLIVLERWAFGPYGELGHILRRHEDVEELARSTRPRAGLAVFPARMIIPVEAAPAVIAESARSGPGAGPEMTMLYLRGAGRPLGAASFRNLRQLDALLDEVSAAAEPRVLVAPKYVDWNPPEVETYVCPDADGVARSRLAYHVHEPD